MGEPLNFVPGGERLFKNHLRELLIILCMGEMAAWSEWVDIVGGGGLPTLMRVQVGYWPTRNHIISLVCAELEKFSHLCRGYSPPPTGNDWELPRDILQT